ncbi:MAG: RsmB/NOP family class I SAM-dependent RNA methyltransferase [Pseudomonadota bacterium]
MKPAGRIAATIDILTDFEQRRVPLKTAIADWARSNRYAGAKDRAWISGLTLDALRRRDSLAAWMGDPSARAIILGALTALWKMPVDDLAVALAEEPHGAGAMTAAERAALTSSKPLPSGVDCPDWVRPYFERAFGPDYDAYIDAFCQRADIDLRLNTLKGPAERALSALKAVRGGPAPFLATAARITAPDPSEKAPSITVIPAFNKGWVEVQDLGSQLAAAATGNIAGKQVLDFCAGGGGKTLALAAQMKNTGQLHAYDISAHRLKPLYARAKRAGLRNVQIHHPAPKGQPREDSLNSLRGAMDIVFVDAPCSGSGTWRRHPDTKWRLTPQQLQTRQREQDIVLQSATAYVKPGGLLIYVTCSIFREENEDRIASFQAAHKGFEPVSPVDKMIESALLRSPADEKTLRAGENEARHLRLTPHMTQTDGFCIAVLKYMPGDK